MLFLYCAVALLRFPPLRTVFMKNVKNTKCRVTLVTKVGGFDFTKLSVPLMVNELKWVSKEAIVAHFVYLWYFLEDIE